MNVHSDFNYIFISSPEIWVGAGGGGRKGEGVSVGEEMGQMHPIRYKKKIHFRMP